MVQLCSDDLLVWLLQVIAFGFVVDETSYLRDVRFEAVLAIWTEVWNWLDFIVVVTGILQMTPVITSSEGVGFLRMPGD